VPNGKKAGRDYVRSSKVRSFVFNAVRLSVVYEYSNTREVLKVSQCRQEIHNMHKGTTAE